MTKTKRILVPMKLIVLTLMMWAALAATGCPNSSSDGDSADKCPAKGLDNDPCSSNSDCFSGYCPSRDKICTPPVAGEGVSCTTTADCEDVVGPELINDGVVAHCYGGTDSYQGCGFDCVPGGGGTGSGSGSGSGSG